MPESNQPSAAMPTPRYPEENVHWVSAVSREPINGAHDIFQMPVASRKADRAREYIMMFLRKDIPYEVSSITLKDLRAIGQRFAHDGAAARELPASALDRMFGRKQLWLIVYADAQQTSASSEIVRASSGRAVVAHVEASGRIAPLVMAQEDFEALIERLEAVRDGTSKESNYYAETGPAEIEEAIQESARKRTVPTSGPIYEMLQRAKSRRLA